MAAEALRFRSCRPTLTQSSQRSTFRPSPSQLQLPPQPQPVRSARPPARGQCACKVLTQPTQADNPKGSLKTPLNPTPAGACSQ